jgi:hypothetical protein
MLKHKVSNCPNTNAVVGSLEAVVIIVNIYNGKAERREKVN